MKDNNDFGSNGFFWVFALLILMFGGNGGGFNPFGKNEMPDGMKPPTDENGNIQMPDGFTPPTGEDGRPQKPQSGHGRLQQPTEEDSEN